MDSYLKFYILNLKYSIQDFNFISFNQSYICFFIEQHPIAIASPSSYPLRRVSNVFILEKAIASTELCVRAY